MVVITQFQATPGDDPTQITNVDQTNIQVEPLGGVEPTVDQLMERFPDTVYDRGTDTHLYRFMTALCGDAGTGLLKKQSYYARLVIEGQLLNYTNLDTFYTQNFRFYRLRSELYSVDADATGLPLDPVNILESPEWDGIEAADNSYRNRMMDYMHATRIGNSPAGISLAARGATGIEVEVIENYKAVYDSICDDIQGVAIQGITSSTNEFILTPRVTDANNISNAEVAYQANLAKHFDPLNNTTTWTSDLTTYLNPDIERNLVDLMDRIRPVNSLMTILPNNIHYKPVAVSGMAASSSRFRLIRFVTGNVNVEWPSVDPATGAFIVTQTETEAPYQPSTIADQPNIYQTIENSIAYDNRALLDPTYGSAEFLSGPNPPYQKYKAEHFGAYYSVVSKIFTFLSLAQDVLYDSLHGLASNNTIATVVGRFNSRGNNR